MSRKRPRRVDLLHPASLIVLAALAAAWLAAWQFLDPDTPRLRTASRVCGYLTAIAMLVSYLHIVRRWWLHRHLGHLSGWMQLHVAGAYLALAFALVHTRAHADGPLTALLLAVFWLVILSGVVGHFGHVLLYRTLRLNLTVPEDPARREVIELKSARTQLLQQAEEGPKRLEFLRALLLEEAVEESLGYVRVNLKEIKDQRQFCAALQETDSPSYRLLQEVASEDHRAKIAESCQGLTGAAKLPPKQPQLYPSQLVNTLNALLETADFSRSSVGESCQPTEQTASKFSGDGSRASHVHTAWANRVLLERLTGGQLTAKSDLPARCCMQAVGQLERPFRFWKWLFSRKAKSLEMPLIERAREFATEEQKPLIENCRSARRRRRGVYTRGCRDRRVSDKHGQVPDE